MVSINSPKKDGPIKRGAIVIVQFSPSVGSETKDRHHAVVVSIDRLNERSPVITVVPLSTKVEKFFPVFEVLVEETGKPAKVDCTQVRTISKDRIIGIKGQVSQQSLSEIGAKIKLALGLD